MNTMAIPEISDRMLAEVALTREEYELACRKLGRIPTQVELGMIGALWSEHCGYKTSKPLLRDLPTKAPWVVQGPGENAGAIDIGNDLVCVFKIESHNHPSAIEPYQGAATGVGGILRDIFTMGARPVALLDSLRFGPFLEAEQRRLLDGVVAGIGGYGNCMGIPTVGGEIYFDESYRYNCLVNAMCVGVAEKTKLVKATATEPGSVVLLVGADTGRDGIHGATFASVELNEASAERRPAVQVGNPFLEKCLMEACLELAGDPRLLAMQDLGAAGLTSSAAELAHRGGCGIEIDVAKVSRRESGMSAYEVMLSESQERMLVVIRSADVSAIRAVFSRWDLHSDVIGSINDSGEIVINDGDKTVARLSLAMLVDEVPLRHPESTQPVQHEGFAPITHPASEKALLQLLGDANIGSRRAVFRRYDHQVGDNTIVLPGGDAAVVRVDGTSSGLALTTDGNAHYGQIDPRRGAEIAVCEAARNIVATGAMPLAVTNCLNFGNPEKPEVMWQLQQAVTGMSDACRALGIPIVSGNVSLYNDNQSRSIAPTPVIGMVGKIDDVSRVVRMGFSEAGLQIAVVGTMGAELGGSMYRYLMTGDLGASAPALDLEWEKRIQTFVLEAARQNLLGSCHDISDGGLAVALAESALATEVGCRIEAVSLFPTAGQRESPDLAAGILFGETQSRFLISAPGEKMARIQALAHEAAVPIEVIGVTGGNTLSISGVVNLTLATLRIAYDGALSGEQTNV